MRTGGRYRKDPKTGEIQRIAPPTQNHPKGNRARRPHEADHPTRVVADAARAARKKGK